MPSSKKRINLTVPDDIYERLQVYMKENGLLNDATACLQLVVQQLRNYETGKVLVDVMRTMPKEQLASISLEGISCVKDEIDKLPSVNQK